MEVKIYFSDDDPIVLDSDSTIDDEQILKLSPEDQETMILSILNSDRIINVKKGTKNYYFSATKITRILVDSYRMEALNVLR